MPVRSILDFNIDDSKFLSIKRLSDQIQDSVKKMPAAWAQVSKQMTTMRSGLQTVVEEATAVRTQADLFRDAIEEANKHTVHTAGRWGAIAEGAKKAASHVHVMTRNFLQWAGIGGGFFTGPGGLWRMLVREPRKSNQ